MWFPESRCLVNFVGDIILVAIMISALARYQPSCVRKASLSFYTYCLNFILVVVAIMIANERGLLKGYRRKLMFVFVLRF